jgi:putative endonuclease
MTGRHVPIKIGMDSNICTGSTPVPGTKDHSLKKWSFFMFYVYILKSVPKGRYYIGYSENPDRRLIEHNSGKVASTCNYCPWVKVYVEILPDELSAIRREKEIKSQKSRKYIETLINRTNLGKP